MNLEQEEQKNIFLNKLKQGELTSVKAPWFKRYFELQFLEENLSYPHLEELIIHHPQQLEIITSQGKKFVDIELDHELWNWIVSYLCLKHEKPFHLNQPFTSFMLPINSSRANQELMEIRASFIHKATLPGPYHKGFFRILPRQSFPLTHFSSENLTFLLEDVGQKKNILISGGTGSGKTSLLKTLFHYSAKNKDHIITIEDTHELQHNYPWVTSLIAKEHESYSMEKYLAYSMRMRPERILLGEIRSREVVPLILALNCGHNGMLATVHANSAPDALERLGTLFQIYNQESISHNTMMSLLCHNIHLVVHLEKKEITQIIKVLGHDEGHLIFDTVWQKQPWPTSGAVALS